MMSGLTTAFRTLSILPVPGKDTGLFSSSLPWFPLVGFILACILYCITYSLNLLTGAVWPEVSAFIVVMGGIIITGGLHLDGLADWADSLGCLPDRERMLAVMKDSRTGVFGVCAIVVSVLGKWIALVKLSDTGMFVWLTCAYVISRTIIVDIAVWLPYARPEGGTGAALIRGANTIHRLSSMIVCFVLIILLTGPGALVVFFIGWIIGRAFGFWCRRKIGGLTGDLLGACSEIVETSLLLIGAAWGNSIISIGYWKALV